MTTVVYLNHDSGDLYYEQFDTAEEAEVWVKEVDWKCLIIDGIQHEVFDHT
ncbi:MAG: hypothetical protein WC763_07260 [Candidatus Paceibacterota bacterium]|jgi:hypothetical protein